MTDTESQQQAIAFLNETAGRNKLDIRGGAIRRTSSRFCLGVEHGDYNGTELFGVGTDRFIWLGYKPNDSGKVRLYSCNFPDDGVIEFKPGKVPPPRSKENVHSWARFAYGVDYILSKNKFSLRQGFDGVIYGNIPGGGMSRSASLSINLLLTMLEVNGLVVKNEFDVIDLTQAVENEYIGSPCGQLDQIMIYFAREGMGTHYNPRERTIEYVRLGESRPDFRLVSLDTGTERPGLEKSTYKVRRAQCDEFAAMLKKDGYPLSLLADVTEKGMYDEILSKYQGSHPELTARFNYIFHAQKRFYQMLEAWKQGDLDTIGRVFRQDGIGLRDIYSISGPELESMCDIARTVPGVLGERMLGGGDKGTAGAIVLADAVEELKQAVRNAYPRSRPLYADTYAVHVLKTVDGVSVLANQ